MASYPTSVKSFAARSAGQTIASAHMNDVQDEINAIEAGLLNGTAPLNSSNSTVASLSATNSTITNLAASVAVTQSLQVNGGSTFAGGMTVNGLAGMSNVTVLGVLRAGVATQAVSAGESSAYALSTAGTFFMLSSTGASTASISTISGVSRGQTEGEVVGLFNIGAPTINLNHANSSAASSNQIITPQGLSMALKTHENVLMVFDGTNWRVLSNGQV